jgi:L-fuconate dehydratase
MIRVVALDTYDIRFPTSQGSYGSDAMNPAPDYAAAYVVVRTDEARSDRVAGDGGTGAAEGHGFSFTIGRGNDVQVAAIRSLAPLVVGLDVDEVMADLGAFSRRLVWDSPLRWLGPEKGVMHMAIGAVINAMWDLRAKRAGQPLWRLLAGLSPEEIVSLVDFRYLSDALTPDEALDLLRRGSVGASARAEELARTGYPAYSTSAGWLGYGDEQVVSLCNEAVASGFPLVKLKVGAREEDDLRRCRLAREVIGSDVGLAVDANQVWDVEESVARVRRLDDLVHLAWIEEPTSPDDILGLARIRREVGVPVAVGEHVPNRVVFKQLLQHRAMDIMQIDACRVAGVNENIANLLLAAKFGVPVYPHAGGVGLCELVQHLAMFNGVALGGVAPPSPAGPLLEWIDHLHEHFVEPATVVAGHYRAPSQPGASTEMRKASMNNFSFPNGPAWTVRLGSSAAPAGEGELSPEGRGL